MPLEPELERGPSLGAVRGAPRARARGDELPLPLVGGARPRHQPFGRNHLHRPRPPGHRPPLTRASRAVDRGDDRRLELTATGEPGRHPPRDGAIGSVRRSSSTRTRPVPSRSTCSSLVRRYWMRDERERWEASGEGSASRRTAEKRLLGKGSPRAVPEVTSTAPWMVSTSS